MNREAQTEAAGQQKPQGNAPRMAGRVVLKWNNTSGPTECAWCNTVFDATEGPALMLEGTWHLICDNCVAEVNAPMLAVARVAQQWHLSGNAHAVPGFLAKTEWVADPVAEFKAQLAASEGAAEQEPVAGSGPAETGLPDERSELELTFTLDLDKGMFNLGAELWKMSQKGDDACCRACASAARIIYIARRQGIDLAVADDAEFPLDVRDHLFDSLVRVKYEGYVAEDAKCKAATEGEPPKAGTCAGGRKGTPARAR